MDVAEDGVQAWFGFGPLLALLAKTLADVAGQRMHQTGLAAETVRRQAAAVAGGLAHLGQGHAHRAAPGHDLQRRLQQPVFGLFAAFGLAAALCRSRQLAGRAALGAERSGHAPPTRA